MKVPRSVTESSPTAATVAQKKVKAKVGEETPVSVITDILQVATQEFAEHGLAGARIERIVQNTRTSKRMIYYHFGSKEGLFRAVLDQAFAKVREIDQSYDPEAGSAEEALRAMAHNAFEAFNQHPAFVRLLTYENLGGAQFIRESSLVTRLNRRAMADLQRVIERGQQEGTIRPNVQAIDVYINMVGLCYYHVAHHAGFRAGGFGARLGRAMEGSAFQQQRKRAISDTCWRYVKAG